MADIRTYSDRDTSVEPSDQDLTVFLYQPYLEAFEAVTYPSIWKARQDERYGETLQHYGSRNWMRPDDARGQFQMDVRSHIDIMVWDYFRAEASDGEFYSFIRKHIEELAVAQTALLDLTVHGVEDDVIVEFDEIPDWFKDVPSFEGAGSLLMERNLQYVQAEWERVLNELHLIKRQDFLAVEPNRRYRMTVTALQKIVAEAWDAMNNPADEDFPLLDAMPEVFDTRIKGVVKFLLKCLPDAEDVELLKVVRRWDRYIEWFVENDTGRGTAEYTRQAVEVMEPLADILGYDLSHHLSRPRLI